MSPANAPNSRTGANWHAVSSADRDAAAGEVQDEQRLGDQRQPVADLRDPLADEEQPEVADPQRAERLVREAG